MDYHVAVLIHVRQSESVVKKGGKGKKKEKHTRNGHQGLVESQRVARPAASV